MTEQDSYIESWLFSYNMGPSKRRLLLQVSLSSFIKSASQSDGSFLPPSSFPSLLHFHAVSLSASQRIQLSQGKWAKKAHASVGKEEKKNRTRKEKKFGLRETNGANSNVIFFLVMSSRLLQILKSIQGAQWDDNLYINWEELEH